MITRYNYKIIIIIHHIEDFIMIYLKNINKLQIKWRESFRINDYNEFHKRFFTLLQLNDRKIKHLYYDDYLKQFVSRLGYFVETFDILLLLFKIVRYKRVRFIIFV